METTLTGSDFEGFGHNVGKMISDVFLKNPLDEDWSPKNSNIVTAMMRAKPRLDATGLNFKHDH